MRTAAQRGIPLLRGEGRVLAELIGLLALFPALRHWLSILQQKIEVAELGKKEEGAILQCIPTHRQQGVGMEGGGCGSFNINANESSGALLMW